MWIVISFGLEDTFGLQLLLYSLVAAGWIRESYNLIKPFR